MHAVYFLWFVLYSVSMGVITCLSGSVMDSFCVEYSVIYCGSGIKGGKWFLEN